MLETLKEAVCAANLELVKRGVVIYTCLLYTSPRPRD